jgi:hypothetical protein
MSDTPRVNATIVAMSGIMEGVPHLANLARQLERELNEVRAKLELCMSANTDVRRIADERNSLRAINAELEEQLQWYVDNDDTYSDDDNEFWATGNRLAVSALAKSKESRKD